MMTVIEMRYKEVVVRQLPLLVCELRRANDLLEKLIDKDGTDTR